MIILQSDRAYNNHALLMHRAGHKSCEDANSKESVTYD